MHVAIIGAGVVGVTSAWYLRQAGCEVTVIERAAAPALETSFANGGQISISHPEPWANPRAPLTVLRWLGREDAPIKFRWRADPEQWRWGAAFVRECLPARTRHNTAAIATLAAHSISELQTLRRTVSLDYDAQTRGILHLSFNETERRHAERQARLLTAHGISARWLSPRECMALEPALSHLAPRLVGGLHGTGDESGDAHRFTTQLAERVVQAGGRFLFEHTVEEILRHDDQAAGLLLRAPSGEVRRFEADAYLVCAGSYSPRLARPLGERLPIHPVKGYSITAPIINPERAPTLSITDESRRIVCSPLGARLRVAGTAELNGYDLGANPAREALLVEWLATHFPGAADLTRAEPWRGLRPTTPGNVPIIGRARLGRLWYNTGHGTLGWTLACGSAAAIRDLMTGQKPLPGFPFHLPG